MNARHTQGRLRAELDTYPVMICGESETWPLVDELGNEEGRAGVFVANTGDNKANARRLVACWNACEGISTETLEQAKDWAEAGVATAEMLRAQRDELIATLRHIEGVAMADDPRDLPGIAQTASEAIAKVESGAA